jgi:hypothetical protein
MPTGLEHAILVHSIFGPQPRIVPTGLKFSTLGLLLRPYRPVSAFSPWNTR